MQEPRDNLRALFTDKPECIIRFPEWMLPAGAIAAFRNMEKPAIVEIAGRDSVAAAIAATLENGFTDLLPTYAYTGTEHGPWESVRRSVNRLYERLKDVRVHEPIVLGSPRFWQAMNGRYISALISRYGFFTPCVGCHLYLHSVRLPLARLLGDIPIIAGERESHDGSVKVNQTSVAITAYEALCSEFGVKLLLPLRFISEGERIEAILGFEWAQGGEQLGCVLSGNYRRLDRGIDISEEHVASFLKAFALPLTRKIVAAYMGGRIPAHLDIAAEVLKGERRFGSVSI